MRLLGDSMRSAEAQVDGERGTPAVHRERSLQARLRSIVAAALMGIFGLSALAWYYTGAIGRSAHARASAQKSTQSRVQGEVPLPPLGRVDPPPAADPPAAGEAPGNGLAVALAPPPAVAPVAAAVPSAPESVPLLPYLNPATPSGPGYPPAYSPAPAKTAAQLAFERRLAGRVFGRREESASTPDTAGEGRAPASATESPGGRGSPAAEVTSREEGTPRETTALLAPNGAASTVQPRVLPTQRFLLPKGAFIDCTLETAIDSTLPGITTCVTATDTFGADGTVVLLERGTKLIGETRGQVLQGAARVGVIWTEARTPTGVVVPLDSPATDELGRSGLPGTLNRHFWERFGAAILITTLDGAVQAGVQSASHGSGTVIYNPGPSEAIGTEVLRGTLAIAPTVVKAQGDRVQAIVARDIDFRSVYELRVAAPH